MADKKISALTGATTPLAGTEVLPIVQSSTTKQVSVANLTAGRAVSMKSLDITDSGTTGGVLRLSNSDNDQTVNDVIGRVEFYSADADDPEVKAYVRAVVLDAFGRDGYLSFGTTATGGAVTEHMTLGTTGNATITAGNLVIGTAGKGIDFSIDPSAAGMTSELLDDYEEGAWTPALSDGTNSSSFTASSGWYTKVGNLVTIGFGAYNLDVSGLSATTSPLRVTGLPFASGSKGAYNAAALPINLTGENLFFVLGGSATSIFINRATGTVDSTSLTRAGAGTPNNMSVYGQITYNV